MSFRELLKGAAKIAIRKGALHLQKSELNAAAKDLESNLTNLSVGELVKVGTDRLALVVSPKTEKLQGLLASIEICEAKWHFENSYNPYLHEVAYDGTCDLMTDAISRTDGMANQTCVLKLADKLDAETQSKRGGYGCPPHEYNFPAFDVCKRFGDGWYLPAIEELYALFNDEKLAAKWFSLVNKKNNVDYCDKEKLFFWSSTDNGNRTASDSKFEFIYYSEALALEISLKDCSTISSRIKSENAYVVPFCRF